MFFPVSKKKLTEEKPLVSYIEVVIDKTHAFNYKSMLRKRRKVRKHCNQ